MICIAPLITVRFLDTVLKLMHYCAAGTVTPAQFRGRASGTMPVSARTLEGGVAVTPRQLGHVSRS